MSGRHRRNMTDVETVRVVLAVGMAIFWLAMVLLAVWALSRLRIH